MGPAASSFKVPLFIFVSVLAFGTGIVLVTATQKNTENRSRASAPSPGPYLTEVTTAACPWRIAETCYEEVVPYWIQVLKDPRCNGTSSEPCPYPPVELTPEQQEAVNATLPPCTVALEFANIACNPQGEQ